MSRHKSANRRKHSAGPSLGLDILEPRMLLSDTPMAVARADLHNAPDVLAAVVASREGGTPVADARASGRGDDAGILTRAADDGRAFESARGEGRSDDSGGDSDDPARPARQSDPNPAPNPAPDPGPDPGLAGGGPVFTLYNPPTTLWSTTGGASLATLEFADATATADPGVLDGLGTMPDIFQLPLKDFYNVVGDAGVPDSVAGGDLLTKQDTPIADLLSLDLAELAGPTSQGAAPTIGLLGVSQPTVSAGDRVILTASGVQSAAGTAVDSVSFYRESGETAGLQTLADVYLGKGVLNDGEWTLATSTGGLSPGDHTYYAVAADSKGALSPESLATLTVLLPAPGKDTFALAQPPTGTAVPVKNASARAAEKAGEPNIVGNLGGRTVWYTWTAMTGGKVTVDTAGSTFQTMVGVYTGNAVNAVSLVTSNEGAKGNTAPGQVTFDAVRGVTYRIAVEGYPSGSVQLKLNQVVTPSGDNVAVATPPSGSPATAREANAGAAGKAGARVHRAQPAATGANAAQPPSP